jgi:putative membrane protein
MEKNMDQSKEFNTRTHKSLQKALFIGLASIAFISTSVLANDLSMSDKRFLKSAAQSGNYEIEGSKLAESKAKSPEVKSFAKHIIEDHTKAASELKALASKKGVELPAKPSLLQRTSLKLLGTHDGAKFDESYAENIGVDAHESAVEDFTEAANSADDADVKQFAAKTLPVLKKHLEMAKTLESKTDKAK